MTARSRTSLLGLLLALIVCGSALPSPAAASWGAGGWGAATAPVATLGSGNQPTVSGAAQTVTVSWAQTWFQGNLLGTYTQGGYTVRRQPAAGGTAVTPGTACNATITGAAATLSCQETSVPVGQWRYTITPVLGSWTGQQSPASASVQSAPSAPVLTSVTAQDPATGQNVGAIALNWAAATGASGYNVYRRTVGGSYNYAAPLNGATPLTGTSYTDPAAGLTGGTTYAYVVRGVASSIESANSNERTASAIARPAAPGGVTATLRPAAQVLVGWSSVSGATGYNVYRRTSTGAYNFLAPLNGATPVTGTSFLDTTSANATTYLYVVRAVGPGAGSTGVESVNSTETTAVTADSTTPTAVSLTPPATTLRSSVSLTGSASDTGSGIALLRFQLAPAGTTIWTDGCTTTTSPSSCNVATTSFSDGLYDLRVLATDRAGNATASATATSRRIDNTAPAVTMNDPGAFVRGTVTLTATATETGSGLTTLRIERSPTGANTWTTVCSATASPASCPWNTTTLPAGGYDLRAIGIDAAGNIGTSALVANRVVDNTAPSATDVQATNKAGGTAGSPEAGDVITYSFSEPMAPASILGGWSGAATPVTVRIVLGNPDVLLVYNAANTTQLALGSANAGTVFSIPDTTFSASSMVLSGNTIAVTLGTPSAALPTGTAPTTLQWTPSTSATDRAGNPLGATTVTESGAADIDF